jgi:hypothetical protein
LGQAFKQGGDDVERFVAVADMRVEVVGFSNVSEVQRLGPVARFDRCETGGRFGFDIRFFATAGENCSAERREGCQ